MILTLLKHLGWLLFYGLIWAYIFSFKLADERTVFETGYEYLSEKKWQKDVDQMIEDNQAKPIR